MKFNLPTINNLIDDLKANKNEIKGFDDVVNRYSSYSRCLLIGDIDPELGEGIETFIRFFNKLDDENKVAIEDREPIKLYIDSCGGDLDATFTIIDAIKLSKTPVCTINIGNAYSGGFFIFIAGDKRYAYPHSTFLYHEGSTATGGTAGQFENYSAFYKKQLAKLREHTLEKTKISEEKYNEIKKEDFWMMSDEALELGVCDKILEEFV